MKHRNPIEGKKVAFRIRGKDGVWRDLESKGANLSVSGLSPLGPSLVSKKGWTGQISPPTAQDDLVLEVMVFPENHEN